MSSKNSENKESDEVSLPMRQAAVLGIALLVILLTALLVYIFTRTPRPAAAVNDTTSGDTAADTTDMPAALPQTDPPVSESDSFTTADTLPEPVTGIAGADDSSENPESVTENVSIVITGTPSELESEYSGTVLAATSDAGAEYLNSIIFLGDSTTYGLKYYAVLDGGKQTKQVWTPTSGTLTLSQASFVKIYYPDTDTEILIKDAAELKKPQYLIITLGVNGVSFMGETDFVSEYKKLIESIIEVSPDTKIILQSIFPVAQSYQYQDSINNEKINAANGWIVKLASDMGLKYLNTASALVGDDGYLPESYQNGDGLHLNEVSAAIVTEYIRTHAYT